MRILAASLICVALAFGQDKKAPKPCDMKNVSDGLWCGKCQKVLDKDKVDNGKCKECKTDIEQVKVCAKEWIPRCGMHEMRPHETKCCESKTCCKVEEVRCRVGVRCKSCGAWAVTEDKISHDKKDHEKQVEASCEKSGEFPHGGELKPKFEREAKPCACAKTMGAGKCKCNHCSGAEGAKCYCGTGGCQCGIKMTGCQCLHCSGCKGGDDGKDGCGCVKSTK